MEKDVTIIIPAFNEEKSISLVLNHIPMQRVHRVIVVNNASTDNTAEEAQNSGAQVIYEPQQGYGQACLTGLAEARKEMTPIVVFIDGDYSDFPEEMELLLEEIDKGADIVIGSRTRGKAQSGALLPQAAFGNWLATNLLQIFFGGYKFSDLGPFRAITWNALDKIKMEDENFGWTVEMQAKALLFDLKCSEVSVSYRERVGVSKITGTLKGTVLAGYKILYTIFKYYFLDRVRRFY